MFRRLPRSKSRDRLYVRADERREFQVIVGAIGFWFLGWTAVLGWIAYSG